MKSTNKNTQTQRSASNMEVTKTFPTKSSTQGASIEDFERQLLDINIKKPQNAFNFYIKEIREKHNIKGKITETATKYANKYKNLSSSELARFQKAAEDDKKRYEEHIDLVRKYVIEKPFKENATPFLIYMEEKVREAREKGVSDIKEFKKIMKDKWENEMTLDELNIYDDKLEKHKEYYEELRKSPRPPNAYALFVQDQMAYARENDQICSFQICAEKWNKFSTRFKERYAEYAEEIAEEAKNNRHIYELAYGIKPKLPISAFRFFYKEAFEKKQVYGRDAFKKARELFEEISEEEKEKYLKMAKREKLAYEIKKRAYNSKNKLPTTPNAYNLFVAELKGTASEKFSQEGFFNYAIKKWRNLDEVKKRKLEKEAKRLKEESVKEYEEKSRIEKSAPKRALTAYNLYTRDKLAELKEKHPQMAQTDYFVIIGEEFAKISDKERYKLNQRAEKEKERFEEEKKEYDLEVSEMNLNQLEKIQEKKEKERESRSISRMTKRAAEVKRSKSKSKAKKADESGDEQEDANSKRGQNKRGKNTGAK